MKDSNKQSFYETVFKDSLELIIDATKIGLWDWHLPSGKVIYSKQWENIVGYSEGELPQTVKSWENAVLPEDLKKAEQAIEAYLAGETDSYEAEFRIVRKDGSVIWAQDKGTITQWDKNGTPVRLVGVLQDINRLKLAEEEIKENNRHLDFIAHLSELGTWDWDLPTQKISYNDEYLSMLGYTQEEITGTMNEWESFNHPDDLPNTMRMLDDYLAGKIDSYSCETRMKHKDGHYIWTMDMGRISEWDENGEPKRVLGGHLNIDKLKRAEQKLQKALNEIEKYNIGLQGEIQKGIKSLEQMQQNVKVMFEANPHASVIFDNTFRIVDANPATLKFFGIEDKDEFIEKIGEILVTSIPPVNPDGTPAVSVPERLLYAMEHGYCEFETAIVLDGVYIPLNMILKRIPYGDSYAVAAYQLDLRTLKKAREDLERQDLLLKAVNEVASLLISADYGDFTLTFYQALELLGKNVGVDRVYIWQNHEKNGKLYCTQIYEWSEGAQPQQGNSFTVDICYDELIPSWETTLKIGKCINSLVKNMAQRERAQLSPQGIVSILIVPIFIHNKFWGFIGFDDCRQERVFTETEENILYSGAILMGSAMLRNEITRNLIKAKEEALSHAQAKSTFLANMSHEIRTPINAITGMTSIAKNSNSEERIHDCLMKIENASRHLLRIINDILDMSKIEADKFELSPQENFLRDIINNIRNIFVCRAQEKKQNFIVDIAEDVPLLIVCDELRLSQVITNLLGNAIKFTPNNGTIKLTVNQIGFTEEESELEFVVEDSGIGIHSDKLENLFNAFEQSDNGVSRKYGGTGLGLTISKKIIELMGGFIRVESEPDKGSRFIFNISFEKIEPATFIKDPDPVAGNDKSYDFSGKKLLLVEDIEINREIVIALLEETKIKVECAENGLLAVQMFEAGQDEYDIIFMDIQMPVLDGFAATERIRASGTEKAKNIPIIAMTANAFSEDICRCHKSGMDDHIAKPIDLCEVLEKTSKYLKRSLVAESRL